VKKVAIDKGKKRARAVSPVSEQGSEEIEIISVSKVKPVTHHTKRMKKIDILALAETMTRSATQDPINVLALAGSATQDPISVLALAESMTRSAIRDPTSKSRMQGPSHAESPSIPAWHLPKSTSPTAERISKALKKQRLPTSKEMSSFRKSPAFCPSYTLTRDHSLSHHVQCCHVSSQVLNMGTTLKTR
jgi:hypothetical protein